MNKKHKGKRKNVVRDAPEDSGVELAPNPLVTAMSNEIEELRAANAALAVEVEAQGQIIASITLKEWDWDAQNFAEVRYPYAVIKGFVDDLRNKKQWIEDTTSQTVYNRFRRFQAELIDAKNAAKKEDEVASVANLAPAA